MPQLAEMWETPAKIQEMLAESEEKSRKFRELLQLQLGDNNDDTFISKKEPNIFQEEEEEKK